MVKLRVKKLLEDSGHTAYWLHQQLGMSYQSVKKMIDGNSKAIYFESIESLCTIFECEPNDLFEFVDDE